MVVVLMVGLSGLEPLTSRLSGVRSNQLSYRPMCKGLLISTDICRFQQVSSANSRIPSKPNNVRVMILQAHKLRLSSCQMCRPRIPERLSAPGLLRKEVIQPHLPIRLPCYDFTPIIGPTFDGWLFSVTSPASGVSNSRGVTGGVYKARERIHRSMLICDY